MVCKVTIKKLYSNLFFPFSASNMQICVAVLSVLIFGGC